MTGPVTPSIGISVVHLFGKPRTGYEVRRQADRPDNPVVDRDAIIAAVADVEAAGGQVVPVSVVGHKADVCFMALAEDLLLLRRFQTAIQRSGIEIVDSYVSMTEVSEYAADVPEKMQQMRLYPSLPPKGKPAWCFYPMSKRRNVDQNWFALPFEQRRALMYAHGTTGRTFAGRILQLVTGSTGVDDWEWGVTLFGAHLDDLKHVVYTMRYDKASAHYGEFGTFYTGVHDTIEVVLDQVGID